MPAAIALLLLLQAPPVPDAALRGLVAEARAMALEAGDALWDGYADAPFGILLIEPERETLFCHDGPAAGFEPAGDDPLTGCAMKTRERVFPTNLRASFPAMDGVPTVVIGTPEGTELAAWDWALMIGHEHFHQLQNAQPGYFDGVAALDLAGEDASGMWMLNYPFPYDDPDVSAAASVWAEDLLIALNADAGGLPAAVRDVIAARGALAQRVSEADWRYAEFQLWQEGVARWTEAALAGVLAGRPVPDGWPAMADLAQARETRMREHLLAIAASGFEGRGRVAFYALGAAEAGILERAAPDWRARYFAEPFALGPYFPAE